MNNTALETGVKEFDDCPKCKVGSLERIKHRWHEYGDAPDADWLLCLDCGFQTDPE